MAISDEVSGSISDGNGCLIETSDEVSGSTYVQWLFNRSVELLNKEQKTLTFTEEQRRR